MFIFNIHQTVTVPKGFEHALAPAGSDRGEIMNRVKGVACRIINRSKDYYERNVYKVVYYHDGVRRTATLLEEWLVEFKNEVTVVEED